MTTLKLKNPIKGIDVSHWQGEIDWVSPAFDDIRFVILKAGGSDAKNPYIDNMFHSNYEEAHKYYSVGAYYYAGDDLLRVGGKVLAARMLEIVKGKMFELPLFIDIEQPLFLNQQEKVTYEVNEWVKWIHKNKYAAGVYASDVSGYYSSLDLKSLLPCVKWVARYGPKPSIVKDYDLWQYTGQGKVKGIKTPVDINYCFTDIEGIYPLDVARALIDEIFAGQWGNGAERKEKLEQAGYDYNAVQAIINEIIRRGKFDQG